MQTEEVGEAGKVRRRVGNDRASQFARGLFYHIFESLKLVVILPSRYTRNRKPHRRYCLYVQLGSLVDEDCRNGGRGDSDPNRRSLSRGKGKELRGACQTAGSR